MKKTQSLQIGLLSSVAAALAGCTTPVHVDQYGRCVGDRGAIVSPNVCNSGLHAGGGSYYYGGSRYSFTPSPSVAPSGGTVRGVFGESAGHGGSGGGSGAGE